MKLSYRISQFLFKVRQLLKGFIRIIPFKRPVFLGMRAIGLIPPAFVHQRLFYSGPFSFSLEGKKVHMVHTSHQIENSLFWKGVDGEWERTSLQLWIKAAKQARVILDIGANTGAYSLIAKAVNPGAKVIAFEPLPKAIEYFKKNCELNQFDIILYGKALSNFEGEAVVHLEGAEDFAYAVAVNRKLQDPDHKTRELRIETTTLRKVIEEQGLETVDLIKIDVEGHEAEVLETVKDYLELWSPIVLIEILTDEVARRIEGIVGQIGYHYLNIDEKGSVERVEHLRKSSSYNFLLCPAAISGRFLDVSKSMAALNPPSKARA